jgi:diadenosine tetraphosphate (Ap4A) HIT family hydrolase
MFALDPRLAADGRAVTDWPLCQVRLVDDRRYPWLVLVPRLEGAVEPFDLSPADQDRLWREANHAGRLLKSWSGADKINIAAIGNIVSQLHVHVVARRVGDAAWPGPVWGVGQADRHGPDDLAETLTALRALLAVPPESP